MDTVFPRQKPLILAIILLSQSCAALEDNLQPTPTAPELWHRDEASFFILWPPLKKNTHYRISISPPDATQSVINVERIDASTKVQSTFDNLKPGRFYTITLLVVTNSSESAPTVHTRRTLPRKPNNVTILQASLTSVQIGWDPPINDTEFDHYRVSITGVSNRSICGKTEITCRFDYHFTRGKTYTVRLQTVSGKTASMPAFVELGYDPLPVENLTAKTNDEGKVTLSWQANSESYQESYLLTYQNVEKQNKMTLTSTENTRYAFSGLIPGQRYKFSVRAVSGQGESEEKTVDVVIRNDKYKSND